MNFTVLVQLLKSLGSLSSITYSLYGIGYTPIYSYISRPLKKVVVSGVTGVSTPLPTHHLPDKRKLNFSQTFKGKDMDRIVKIFYDVERPKLEGGDIITQNGYFIHFMSPKNLPPLDKGFYI